MREVDVVVVFLLIFLCFFLSFLLLAGIGIHLKHPPHPFFCTYYIIKQLPKARGNLGKFALAAILLGEMSDKAFCETALRNPYLGAGFARRPSEHASHAVRTHFGGRPGMLLTPSEHASHAVRACFARRPGMLRRPSEECSHPVIRMLRLSACIVAHLPRLIAPFQT